MNGTLRPILAPLGILALTCASAQITIGPADMPSTGDTVRYVSTPAQDVDITYTEAGVIWDMSALVPGTEGADTAVAVSSTPFLYQLYFNNPFVPEYNADYAVRGQSFDFQGQLTVSDVYDYYKKDDTGFRNVGFGANINGIPASVQRTPVDYVHRFPMNYGDQDTSFSTFTLNVPTVFSFTQQQERYNTVDGWGTLYLPADTFEVLRVRSVLVRTDSVFIEQFGQGFSFPEPETVEYKWIAAGMDEPVLQVVTNAGQPTTARFYYHPEDITTGIAAHASTQPVLFPNPAHDVVFVSLPTGWQGTLLVSDATGRAVRTITVRGGTLERIDLAGLGSGAYSAKFLGGPAEWSSRFVVR
ncbi:MAG: hypothetical protein ABI432_13305 [Flavobacteriales bacterium]